MIIRELRVTPIAFADPPLLNADGVHEPHVLRAVIELVVDDGRGGEVQGWANAPVTPGNWIGFYKWGAHPATGSRPAIHDEWGEALDPAGIVQQARQMVDRYGFGSLKLKGGVFAPGEEIEAVRELKREFPDLPVRIDPNTAWTYETALAAARELDGLIEYLEDPVAGLDDMARLATQTKYPARDKHVCRLAGDRSSGGSEGLRVNRSWRPSLLGRHPRNHSPRRRLHCRRLRTVDALELPPRDKPRRNDSRGGSHAAAVVRLRYALSVERGQ